MKTKKNFTYLTIYALIIAYLLYDFSIQQTTKYHNYKKIEVIKKKYGLDGKSVSIAILDTGIADAKNNINIENKINLIKKQAGPKDFDGHGTYISSIISSKKFGIAPKSEVYIGKVISTSNKGDFRDVSKGVKWATNLNVDIILMSLGGKSYSSELEKEIERAINKNILIISAVGNEGISNRDTVMYPAKYKGVLGVGAIDDREKIWFKSSKGTGVDIVAPGSNVPGYDLNSNVVKYSGTSSAAAYVAGIAALIKQSNKNISSDELKSAILKTAKSTGTKYVYGEGILQVEKSILYHQNVNKLWILTLTRNMFFLIILTIYSLFFLNKHPKSKVTIN